MRADRHEPPAGDGLALEGARDHPVAGVLRLRLVAVFGQRRSETGRKSYRSPEAGGAPSGARLHACSAAAGSPAACAAAASAMTPAIVRTASSSPAAASSSSPSA